MPPTPTPSPLLIQMVDQGSSFWDSPLFTALIAVGGVIIGTALGYIFTLVQENQRAQRERHERWDKDVLDHTSSVITLARRYILDVSDHQAALRVMAQLAVSQMQSGKAITEPPINEPTHQILQQTYETLLGECVALHLVAPKPVRQATEKLQHVAGILFFSEEEDFKEFATNVREAATEVEDEVRKHFGIS